MYVVSVAPILAQRKLKLKIMKSYMMDRKIRWFIGQVLNLPSRPVSAAVMWTPKGGNRRR